MTGEIPASITNGIREGGTAIVNGTICDFHFPSLLKCGTVAIYRFIEQKLLVITLSYAQNGQDNSGILDILYQGDNAPEKSDSFSIDEDSPPDLSRFFAERNILEPNQTIKMVYIGIGNHL